MKTLTCEAGAPLNKRFELGLLSEPDAVFNRYAKRMLGTDLTPTNRGGGS
jgi:hypothetical protein